MNSKKGQASKHAKNTWKLLQARRSKKLDKLDNYEADLQYLTEKFL